jgi:hypothetical protein
VPAHEVDVWCDCSGEPLRGRYAFDDHSFETTGCSGGFLTGSCSTTIAEGRRVAGDNVVERIYITGYERSELYEYELMIRPQPGQIVDAPGASDARIRCTVYRDDETGAHSSLGEKVDCYFSKTPCQARVDIVGS